MRETFAASGSTKGACHGKVVPAMAHGRFSSVTIDLCLGDIVPEAVDGAHRAGPTSRSHPATSAL